MRIRPVALSSLLRLVLPVSASVSLSASLSLLVAGSFAGGAWALGDGGADGRFERRDSFHFTLYQDVGIEERGGFRGSRRFEQQLLGELESAYDRLDALLGLRPRKKLIVYVWDPELFDREYAGRFRFPAAGFYGGAIQVRGDTVVSHSLVAVLHHELVHAAFDDVAPHLRLPAWLNEGIAQWFEARALGRRQLSGGQRALLIAAAREGALFPLDTLSVPSLAGFGPEAAAIAYVQSHAFIDYLVAAHGDRDLIRFWEAVIRSRNLDRAAKRVYRSSLADLEQSFRGSLGTRSGGR